MKLKPWLTTLLLLAAAGPALSQSLPDQSRLQGEFWTEKAPWGKDLPGPLMEKDAAVRLILEGARKDFSGIIYGYDFEYRPSDTARQVTELFRLVPKGSLASTSTMADDNMGLLYISSKEDDNRLSMLLAYQCTSLETSMLLRWRHPAIADSSASGKWTYFDSDARSKAFDAACKEAVRAYARALTRNKPSRVWGSLALAALPRYRVENGEWFADVRVRLLVSEIEDYRTW